MLYDSIDELPIVNFQKYNKYLLIDSGVGSDVDDIDKHITKLAKLINTDKKLAMQELQNMRQNMYMIANNLSPKYFAFASLIYSIDGEVIKDLSDENLLSIIKSLNNVKHSWLSKIISQVKKKIQEELELYFPEIFVSSKDKEAFDKLKEHTLLRLDAIINGNDNSKALSEIDNFFLTLNKPLIFIGPESAEIRYDKQFETMRMLISQRANIQTDNFTVLQFYNALANIEKQIEAENKSLHKTKSNR